MNRAPLAVTTLGDVLVARAQRRPDDVAVAFTEERATAQELLDGALHVAYGLHALGVRPRDKVAIVMPNCMDYVRAIFGAALLGAVVVTVNARYRGAELAYVVEDSGVKALLTSDVLPEVDFVALLDSALPEVATAEDPRALDLEAAPELRACVMLGSSSPPGFVDRKLFDELAATVPAEVIEQTAEAVRAPRPGDHDVHVGHDGDAEGMPAQPRGDRPRRRRDQRALRADRGGRVVGPAADVPPQLDPAADGRAPRGRRAS